MLLGKLLAVVLGLGLITWLVTAEYRSVHYGRAVIAQEGQLVIGGRPLLLWGVKLPKVAATCEANAGSWPCGAYATSALLILVSQGRVMCFEQGDEQIILPAAKCYAPSRFLTWKDVARELVRAGWAMPDLIVSHTYLSEAAEAQAGQAGLWRSEAPDAN